MLSESFEIKGMLRTSIRILSFTFSESQMEMEMNLKRRDTTNLQVKYFASPLENAVHFPY
jgi:hypothetical protein